MFGVVPELYDVCMDGLRSSWHNLEVRYESRSSLPGFAPQTALAHRPHEPQWHRELHWHHEPHPHSSLVQTEGSPAAVSFSPADGISLNVFYLSQVLLGTDCGNSVTNSDFVLLCSKVPYGDIRWFKQSLTL